MKLSTFEPLNLEPMNQNLHLETELFVQKYTQLPGVLYEVCNLAGQPEILKGHQSSNQDLISFLNRFKRLRDPQLWM